MAKVYEIVKQMHAVLPRYTDKFSSDLTMASAVTASPLVTVTTSAVHGLETGSFVNVHGTKLINTIVGFTFDAVTNTVEFETGVQHDLTLDFHEEIEIRGFINYDGFYTLVDVAEGHLKFTISGSEAPVGSGALWEQRIDDINGLYQITVVSDTVFTYNKTDVSALNVA